jgi:hypothetical protein
MKIALALLLLFTTRALAADVPLLWTASPSPEVTGYVLYASTNQITTTNFHSATVRVPLTNTVTATLGAIMPGTWWFTVTAVTGTMEHGLESDPSNILVATVAKPPANLRTMILEYSNTLTNWTESGFFRVKVSGNPPTP